MEARISWKRSFSRARRDRLASSSAVRSVTLSSRLSLALTRALLVRSPMDRTSRVEPTAMKSVMPRTPKAEALMNSKSCSASATSISAATPRPRLRFQSHAP